MSVEELALLVAACPAFKLADLDGSQPQPAAVVLPTVGEVREAIIAGTKLGGWMPHTAAQAVLDLIASRLPVWQPVEPGTVIKAGTVTRIEWDDRGAREEVTRSDYTFCQTDLTRFYLDPRTVPAEPVEPVDPRAELLAEKLHKLVADFQANGDSRGLGDPTAGAWFEAAQQVLDALNTALCPTCGADHGGGAA